MTSLHVEMEMGKINGQAGEDTGRGTENALDLGMFIFHQDESYPFIILAYGGKTAGHHSHGPIC